MGSHLIKRSKLFLSSLRTVNISGWHPFHLIFKFLHTVLNVFHDSNLVFLLCCRIFAVAFSFAFKMVSEIDMKSINIPLKHIIDLPLWHFNTVESAFFAALDFDVGLTEESFNSKFKTLDEKSLSLFRADQLLQSSIKRTESPK